MARKNDEAATEQPDHGQAPALAVRTKARATGTLEKLSPGDPNYGKQTITKPQGKGARVEEDKFFQLTADDPESPMIRVFDTDPNNKDEDIVLFSGSRKQATKVHELLGKFLKK